MTHIRQFVAWSVFRRLGAAATINAIDFFFPRLCLLCDGICEPPLRWLCKACVHQLALTAANRNACPRCSQNHNFHSCTCQIVWDYPFTSIRAFFDFDDRIRRLVHEFKYRGKKHLAYEMGLMIGGWLSAGEVENIDVITAVPLHIFRMLQRGYNQAAWLARGIAAGINRPNLFCSGLVKRTRYTKTQTRLDKDSRKCNLNRAFSVGRRAALQVCGKRIMLIDDVITTGATAAACSSALLEAKAAAVTVVSLARD